MNIQKGMFTALMWCVCLFFFHTACVMRNRFFLFLGGLSLENTTAPAPDLSMFLANFVQN